MEGNAYFVWLAEFSHCNDDSFAKANFESLTFGVVGVLLSETEPLLLSPPPGRSRTRSGVCLFLCSREGSDAVDGLCL